VAGTLSAHVAACKLPQLFIDTWKQRVERGLIAVPPRNQQCRGASRMVGNDRYSTIRFRLSR
jgi:hypothetical protein